MSRIRVGEALAGAGAIAAFVLLFADWFSGGGARASGWSSLGWLLVAIIVVQLVIALVLVAGTIARVKPAIVVGSAVMTVVLGAVALVIVLVRVLVAQPALDMGLGNGAVGIETAAYLGLVALAALPVGGWITLADERTGAPQSAYTPPPPRQIPSP